MKRFIRELRRREVFRTAGLYVGICWILIEAASVFLPTFDAPEWVLRAIIIAMMVGFPVMLVLAWVYDLTESGITVQGDPTDTVVAPLGSRKMDFIVIGVLSAALFFSVYLNVTEKAEPVTLDPLSILIADFDNKTGDPLFEGSLEQALAIGMEGATFITTFGRPTAKEMIESLAPGTPLDYDGARLFAEREGVSIIITGSVTEKSGAYTLTAEAIRSEDGESMAKASVKAKSKPEVLKAVSEIAEDLREDLGDTSIGSEESEVDETFASTSLEALLHYSLAQDLALSAKYEESLPEYEKAVQEAPNFSRALSGWALSLYHLGRQEEATALWERALSKMYSMTDRERYRTLGLYDVAVTGNYEKAIENYSALVARYPADSAGYSDLAAAYFSSLDFANARVAAGNALDIYPANKDLQSTYALYAMYSGDFETARARAEALLKSDSSYYMAWLPIAMSALAADDLEAATAAYDSMSALGERAASLAALGLADLALYRGDFSDARTRAERTIERGARVDGQRAHAVNYLMLGASLAATGDSAAAKAALASALQSTQSATLQLAAALVYLDLGDGEAAATLQKGLQDRLQPQSLAYGKLLEGRAAMASGQHVAAIDTLRAGIAHADLWLIRYYLGQAYLQAGFFAEAMDEFALCRKRQGEATAVFLEDMPSWRYTATLQYWLSRAEEGLSMTDAAKAGYQKFLSVYQADDAISQDAKSRLP